MRILARICATKQSRTKSLATNIGTIPKNMPTNFQLQRLNLKLDIVEKHENRVHKLTDSNGAPMRPVRILYVRHETVSVCALDFLYGFRRYRISIRAKMCVRVRAGICAYQLNCPYARRALGPFIVETRITRARVCLRNISARRSDVERNTWLRTLELS